MKSDRSANVVVLVSGSGTLLQALLDDVAAAALAGDPAPYTVAGVICDKPDAYGLERARAAGVATATVRLDDFPDRATWDVAVAKAVEVFSPDLVVLAGFMRILGEPFLSRFGARTINTHPALLPSFPGAHGVRDALAHGVKVTGTTVILVDPDPTSAVDSGPIVAQRCVPVADDDTVESLHERIKVVERELLVDVVRRMTRHGWTVTNRKVTLP